MRYDRHNRRLFLTGAGSTLVAVPFLTSLLPRPLRREAEAAPPAIPRRFVALKTYNGTPLKAFYPGATPGFETHGGDGRVRLTRQLSEATGRHSDGNRYFGHWAPLSDFAAGGVSGIFGTEFNRHHDNMTLIRGLDIMPNLNHNHGGMLGNFGLRTNGVGGPLPGARINVTADQIMAVSPNVYPAPPVGPRILHVGSRRNTFSYAPSDPANLLATGRSAVQQAQAFINPRTAFDAVLAGVGGASDVAPSVKLVDRVVEDYRRAQRGPLLSARDRQVLEQHMTRLSELEAKLNANVTVTCSEPEAPSSLDTGGEFNADAGDVTQLFDDMVDIVAVAFACDVTRLATIDVTKMVVTDGNDVFGMGDSENANSAGRDNWHFQAHAWDGDAIRWLTQGAEWVADAIILRLLDALAATEQPDGESLLHHSLVMWSNELSFNHLNYSIPTCLWGRAGGYINAGRYIDYIDHDRPVRFRQHDGPVIEGVQFNRMIATLFAAMNVEPSEYELTPNGGFGETHHVDKDSNWAIDYDASNVHLPLPSITI